LSSLPPSKSENVSAFTNEDLVRVDKIFRSNGFDDYGFAELTRPETIGFYQLWLAKGHHGEMGYLQRHLSEKMVPQRLLPNACSAFVTIKNYVPHPEAVFDWPLKSSDGVASYARGGDYHHFLKNKLASVIASLKAFWPEEDFVCFTDSAPVLERELAVRAGLGWVGKNTCLISRTQGSLFFIAEIYTSLRLPKSKNVRSSDHCGTCRRCLDTCPTGALIAPRELDARKCISYLTIESRSLPDESLRPGIGHWLFGCDICQNVCPWNSKILSTQPVTTTPVSEITGAMIEDLRWILGSSNRALERAFVGTPIFRAGGTGLKRNALVVAGNFRVVSVRAEVEALLTHDKLGVLAHWSLKKMVDTLKPCS
jgi:epoxyqueuosine reductase